MNFVVIPSYNGRHLLDRCVRSVTQSVGPWIPLVVDNHSSDGTNRDDIEKLGAMYIQSDTN